MIISRRGSIKSELLLRAFCVATFDHIESSTYEVTVFFSDRNVDARSTHSLMSTESTPRKTVDHRYSARSSNMTIDQVR